MKLLQDLWEHLKSWSEWSISDWAKTGIVVLIVLFVVGVI